MKVKPDLNDPLNFLEAQFEDQPKIKYEEALETINKLGPIPIKGWINQDLIRFNPLLKTVVDQEVSSKRYPQTGEYSGQVNAEG